MSTKQIKQKILAYIGYLFLELLLPTLRIDRNQVTFIRNLSANGNNVIYAFWHSMMLVPGYNLRHMGIHALVSQHRDGGYLANVMGLFGLNYVRGSTTRGGTRAIINLIKIARKGHSIIITPDGPRGPRLVVQPGIIFLARKSGLPIIPIAIKISRYWQLPSWDRFVIPMPFAKVTFTCGEPIYIPQKISNEQSKEYCSVLENALKN